MLEEGFTLLREVEDAKQKYETATKQYLKWYFNNAPDSEKTKTRIKIFAYEFALWIIAIILFSWGFILGKFVF